MVVVSVSSGSPVVLDRRRLELVDQSLPSQPYHAVAEAGAPAATIDAVGRAAQRAVATALRSTERIDVIGLVAAERRIPANLKQILASHALLHAAEGQLYEQAVIDAANEAGLPVHVVEPKRIEISAAVDGLGRSIGPPWQKDHKWATTAALEALAST